MTNQTREMTKLKQALDRTISEEDSLHDVAQMHEVSSNIFRMFMAGNVTAAVGVLALTNCLGTIAFMKEVDLQIIEDLLLKFFSETEDLVKRQGEEND